jgi:parvulin-like peptidyl-prolyl isomerase
MLITVKSLIKFAITAFLLIFASWCQAQTAPKTQPAQSKKSAANPVPAAPKQALPEEDETIPPAEPNALFPAVVAKVNGKPILGRDLESLVRRELATIGNPEWKNLREDYRRQLTLAGLNSLIGNKLLYQEALVTGIKATGAEVQAEMEKITKSFKNDAEMNIALAEQAMDRTSLEKSLYQSLAVAKLVDENINKKITVTPEEVAKYYSTHPAEFQHPDIVRTSHILIPAGGTEEQDALAKKRAESILARAKKGEDFARLAKEFSTDASASRGGDVGFNAKDQLIPEFGQAAFSLPIGGVRLVKSEAGYHIIKVTDKKKEGLATLEEAIPQIAQFLKSQKAQAEYTKFISRLRDQGVVEILIPAGQPMNP